MKKVKPILKLLVISLISIIVVNYVVNITNAARKNPLSEIYTDEVLSRKESERSTIKKEKIVFDGFGELSEDSTASEVADTVLAEDKNVTVSIQFNDDFKGKTERPSFDASEEEINAAIRARREELRAHFLKANTEKLNSLEINNYCDVYVSRYSPYVDLTFSKEEFTSDSCAAFYEIAEDASVDAVYVQTSEDIYSEDIESAFPTVGLPKPVDIPNLDYDGSGVVIGILEANGIVDLHHANIVGCDDEVMNDYDPISEHALRVASIVGANTGVARGAKILSAKLYGDPKSEVEWMLDRNVNIISNSWSEDNTYKDGNYKSYSAYFDYISYLSWVTVCASAGNVGGTSGWVGNPGLGFNVITVGSSTDGNTIADSSSYKENFSISKPTLVAPGEYISLPNISYSASGTSFSTPMVAGTIALLMQEFPLLKTCPELVMSQLTASASKMSDIYYNYDYSGLEDKVGAGKLSYSTARQIFSNRRTFNNTGSDKGYKTEISLYLYCGQTIRISMGMLTNSYNKTDTDFVTDYDLHLIDEDYDIVASSMSGSNNIEFLEYTVIRSGTYTIGAYQCADKKGTDKDYGGISFYIF